MTLVKKPPDRKNGVLFFKKKVGKGKMSFDWLFVPGGNLIGKNVHRKQKLH